MQRDGSDGEAPPAATRGAGEAAAAARGLLSAVPAAADPPLEASGAAQGDNSTAAEADAAAALPPLSLPSTRAIPRSSGSALKLQLLDGLARVGGQLGISVPPLSSASSPSFLGSPKQAWQNMLATSQDGTYSRHEGLNGYI